MPDCLGQRLSRPAVARPISSSALRFIAGARALIVAIGFLAVPVLAQSHPLPIVDLVYPPGGSLLDRLCQTDFHVPVDPARVQAAVDGLPAFQSRWNTEGPAYLRTAFDVVRLPFPYGEVQATLTVCLPASTSAPLVIDVRPFLAGALRPAPDWEFSEIVFHELMHLYVRPVYAHSALLRRYANEPNVVRFHLHVMAMEKLVLLRLGRQQALATIDREYRTGPDPAYRRAWEIVCDIEGYEAFVTELTALAGPEARGSAA